MYIGEINSAVHATKEWDPSITQFGVFAAMDLDSESALIGEYVGLVDTEASKGAGRAALGVFETEQRHYEFRVAGNSYTRKVPLVIDAYPMCCTLSYLNSYQGIADRPNARFMQAHIPQPL